MRVFPALVLAVLWAGAALAQPAAPARVKAIGVESEYANVITEIGGRYVAVTAIETNPNTDPHSFEVSPRIAGQFAAADLIVENGAGYDDWADQMIAAVPRANRQVINVQHLLGLPASTPNPHLWYRPATMPAVAKALALALARLAPAHAAYFRANVQKFDTALQPWLAAMAAFKADFPQVPVAVSEPVADGMLHAMGADILTPFSLQAAIMNGTDPSPQDVATQDSLFTGHKVRIFVYNQQVTDPLTQSFLALAQQNAIPVVGVYETMPTPGYDYQSWMFAEAAALRKALTRNLSTRTLPGNGHDHA